MKQDFSAQINKICFKTVKRMSTVKKKIAYDLAKKIMERSPVDEGTLRANWFCTINQPYGDAPVKATDKDGSATLEKINDVIKTTKIGDVIYITNATNQAHMNEYGLYPNPPARGSYIKGKGWVMKSEFGYSKQMQPPTPPLGMIRLAIEEAPYIIKDSIEETKKEVN